LASAAAHYLCSQLGIDLCSIGTSKEVKKMLSILRSFPWAGLWAAAALFLLGCSAAVYEEEASYGVSDEDFVAAIKGQIDYLVTCEDAMEDIDAVRGRVVKWNGDIVRIWDDKIHIQSHGQEEYWNNFIFILDHPLPKERHIGESIQMVFERDPVYVVGRIMDRKTVLLKSGTEITVPHLRGYIISKDNDRNFEDPVWVGHK
jgi:hypothetical protein